MSKICFHVNYFLEGRAGKANGKFSFLAFANASDSDGGAAACRRGFWLGGGLAGVWLDKFIITIFINS